MQYDDQSDEEPTSVVRSLSDMSMCLTLITLMLIGSRSPSSLIMDERSTSRAATPQPGAKKAELVVALAEEGKFVGLPPETDPAAMDAPALVQRWMKSHGAPPSNVVVQFPARTLAADLHRGLLNLQSAFGTNVRIQTVPASRP